jgi:hypothetical protein
MAYSRNLPGCVPAIGKDRLFSNPPPFSYQESDSLEAHLRKRPSRLPFTWLHELEFINGLQLKVFRGEGTEANVAATLAAVRADVDAGAFFRAQFEWAPVFEGALRFSATYSSRLGTRTLRKNGLCIPRAWRSR